MKASIRKYVRYPDNVVHVGSSPYTLLLNTCKRFVQLALAGLLSGGTLAAADLFWNVLYQNDFETSAGPEWSRTDVSATPAGARKFLGEFANDTVVLSLTNLPSHGAVRLSFDLFIISSWDGNDTRYGPDIWSLSVANGPLLLRTTFGNAHSLTVAAGQAYPGSFPGASYPDRTGAAETNSLGYIGEGPMDSVYHLSYDFGHSGSELALNFAASGLQGLSDESWGLDNVSVAVLDIPFATIRCSQVEVCWNSKTNKTYQVQYRSSLTTNLWTDFGTLQPGNGSTECVTDSVPAGQPHKFYRVVEQP